MTPSCFPLFRPIVRSTRFSLVTLIIPSLPRQLSALFLAFCLTSPQLKAEPELDTWISPTQPGSLFLEWQASGEHIDTVQVSGNLRGWQPLPGTSTGRLAQDALFTLDLPRPHQAAHFYRVKRHPDPGVSITEFMARNDQTIPGPGTGRGPDWIELYNGGPHAISLGGYFLTDSPDHLSRWRFPDVSLASGEFLVIHATGRDQADPTVGALETNFRLATSGGYLALVDPGQDAIVNEFFYREQFEDVSHGIPFQPLPGNDHMIPPKVIAQWNLDEAAGDLRDSAARGSGRHDITIENATFLQAPLVNDGGSSMGFADSTGTPVTLNASDLGCAANPRFTAEGFFAISDEEAGTGLNYIMGSRRTNLGWTVWIRDGGKLGFVLDGTGGLIGTDFFGNTLVDDGQRHHFALVVDREGGTAQGTGRAILYLDGTMNHLMDNIPPNHLDTDDGFFLGRRHNSPFGGRLDLLRFTNEALSPREFLNPEDFSGGNARPNLQPVGLPGSFRFPSPGSANSPSIENSGPAILQPFHTPDHGSSDDPILVTTRVEPLHAPVSEVTLTYRVMYQESQVTAPMRDDGLGPDEHANDGVFSAVIPASAFSSGEMVRWFVTARDQDGNSSRKPEFLRPFESAEYFGTVIKDPDLAEIPLPVLEWFAPDPTWYRNGNRNNRDYTQASLYYAGEFIDNLRIRTRGRTAANAIKPNLKFDFHHGAHLKALPDAGRVEEMNLNGFHGENIWSRSFMRSVFAYEILRQNDIPTPYSFHVHVRRNGEFFGLCAMEEQVDSDFLARQNLNPDGSLYKASGNGNLLKNYPEGDWDKEQPEDENFSELLDLINGISPSRSLRDREQYVFDHITIPVMINYLASSCITLNHDRIQHNFYLYRDSGRSGEWTMLPWDVDRSFPEGSILRDPRHTNLYYGSSEQWRISSDPDVFNRLYDAIFDIPRTREMYLRRVRSLVDEWHGNSSIKLTSLLSDLTSSLSPSATLDEVRWRNNFLTSGNRGIVNSIHTRRRQLEENREIPPSVPITTNAVTFGMIENNPLSGNQDEEFVELLNTTGDSLDLSNWRVRGGIEHKFIAGTVIPAGESLYLSPDLGAFRTRQTGPTGGGRLFLQGDYKGHLSNFGETLELVDANDILIATVTSPADPSDLQLFLRISEIMFNPPPPTSAERSAGFTDNDDFEFIELLNIGASTLPLEGVRFTDGIEYQFPPGTVLAANSRLIVPGNFAAFQHRYGTEHLTTTSGYQVFQDSSNRLRNSGETLKLEDANHSTIHDFRYGDDAINGWYDEADGNGRSLEIIDPLAELARWGESTAWRPSAVLYGSPGS